MELTFLQKFWKPIAIILLVMCSFMSGWKANEVYHGYKDNLEAKIEKKFEDGLTVIQAQGAKNLLDTQALIDKNKAPVIEKEIPVIVEKKVYLNQCFDQAGVDALSKLKEESTKQRTKQ